MPAKPAPPAAAIEAVSHYCETKVPAEHRDKVRVEHSVRGKTVTLFQCQPPWHTDLGADWTRQPVAQLRYDPEDRHWRLYWADRNGRWHDYDMTEPSTDIDLLLAEIDQDPTGIFWG